MMNTATAMTGPKSKAPAERFHASTVLVLEENRGTRQALRDVLLGMGFAAVYQAADGRTGLMEVAAHEPSLILVDYRLPKLDGLSFTEQLRRDGSLGNNGVPVILMAHSVDAELVVAARDAGVTEIVMKPISIQVLVRRLLHILSKARPLVRGGGYIGPDRRRKGERRAKERRGETEVTPTNTISERRQRPTRRGGQRRTPSRKDAPSFDE